MRHTDSLSKNIRPAKAWHGIVHKQPFDENLLMSLASRMEVSRKIGEFKKAHNIAIVQAARWEDILSDMIAKGRTYGLPEGFVTAVFNAIHDASVAEQNRILERE